MLRAGHILNALWPLAVDVNRFPTMAAGATKIRFERVIVVIGLHLDFQVKWRWRNKPRHVTHVASVAFGAVYATTLWYPVQLDEHRNALSDYDSQACLCSLLN